jgi:hypothetical protein
MRQILLLLAVIASVIAPAARAQSLNAAYGEIGGSGIIPTVNYERRLNERWFGRIGLGVAFSYTEEDSDAAFAIPLTVSSVNRPASNHHLELGGGITIVAGDRQELFDYGDDDDENFSTLSVTGIVGYRYQKPDGGFLFRATFTPVVSEGDFLPWAGVSFGYAW